MTTELMDVTIAKADPETAEVLAATIAGADFIDAYTALEIEVVDSGRIVIPETGVFAFVVRAREAGINVEVRGGGLIEEILG